MRAGRRNKRVDLQARTFTDDGMGGGPETWTTYATVWAAVEPLRGDERYASQQVQPGVSHKVTMLYRSDVQAAHRVKFGTRVFEIRSVLSPFEREQTTELQCEESPA